MDARVFDQLARQIGSGVPRRSLAAVLAAVLAMLGLADPSTGKRRRQHKQRGHGSNDHRGRSHRGKPDHVHDEKKRKKKKKKNKGKTQPQSPPPGNASPPPPQSPPPPPGGGGGRSCTPCADACRTCDAGSSSCVEVCGDGDCPTIRGVCAAVAQPGGEHQRLADHLATLGYVPSASGTTLTLLRDDGGSVTAGFVATFQQASGSGTAEVRTARDVSGGFISMMVLFQGSAITAASYVGSDGSIVPVDYSSGPGQMSAMREVVAADTADLDYCWWCNKTCVWGGAQALCTAVGAVCAAMVVDVRTRVLAWLFCNLITGDACQEAGTAACEQLCTGICRCGTDLNLFPCGSAQCCDMRTCQRCHNGQCVGCQADTEYCGTDPSHHTVAFCQRCPSCRGVCEVLDPPNNAAPGDPGCSTKRCQGQCPGGPNWTCQAGECVCVPDICPTAPPVCRTLDDGCGGTLTCDGACPDGEQCEAGICKDPCAIRGCSWTGTFRQKRTFHGTGIYNEVTTLDSVQDVTYDIHALGLATVTSTQSWHWITDDPNICEHHVQYGGWDLAGHTESQVFVGSALGCSAPGSGGGCSFNYQDGGKSVTLQECTTCVSGTCCTPGCHDVGVSTTPGARSTYMGVPTGSTHNGSNTYSEGVCTWGFCGTMSYEWTWNLSYGPIS